MTCSVTVANGPTHLLIKLLYDLAIHDQLYAYFDAHGLLDPCQSGFRAGHSTSSCALGVLDKIYKSLDNNGVTGAIYLDLKKAFDTVPHNILCQKLAQYGVCGSANSLLQDYLDDRIQVTRYRGKLSEPSNITCGVPQGSITGPLLFINYINDLPQVVLNSLVAMYADDMVIYYTGSNVNEVEQHLQEDLDLIINWLAVNKLSLNVGKTKTTLFANRYFRGDTRMSLRVGNEELEQVDKYKYLGIILDNNLTFAEHIDYIANRVCLNIFGNTWIRKQP